MKKILLISIIIAAISFTACGGSKIEQKKLPVTEFTYTENTKYEKTELPITDVKLKEPFGITSDESYFYICDSGNNKVIVCNFDGKIVKEIKDLNIPKFIAADSENLCIYEKGTNRLKFFTKDGNFVKEYSLDNKFDFLIEVTDIEYDESGNILLSIMVSNEKKADKSGIYSVNKDDELKQIKAMSVGKFGKNNDGGVIFASTYEYKDKKWISGYAEMLLIGGEKVTLETGIANDTYSAVSVATYNNEIYVYNDSTMSLDVFSPEFVYKETVFSEEVKPENNFRYADFCTDKDGNFLFTDMFGNKIYKLKKTND
ncbi:MAG: hypothetical protein LBL93_00390 [Ruminococcus sp.]|jgi:hypothetical protein|nr:hypothetical protein [Ruminococcus sp.]